jgi:hypothetical protein
VFRSQGADARPRGGRGLSPPAAVRRMTVVHSAFKVAGHIEVAAGYRGNATFCGVARKAAWSSLPKDPKTFEPQQYVSPSAPSAQV